MTDVFLEAVGLSLIAEVVSMLGRSSTRQRAVSSRAAGAARLS